MGQHDWDNTMGTTRLGQRDWYNISYVPASADPFQHPPQPLHFRPVFAPFLVPPRVSSTVLLLPKRPFHVHSGVAFLVFQRWRNRCQCLPQSVPVGRAYLGCVRFSCDGPCWNVRSTTAWFWPGERVRRARDTSVTGRVLTWMTDNRSSWACLRAKRAFNQ